MLSYFRLLTTCRGTPHDTHPAATAAWNVQGFININLNPEGTEVAREVLPLPDPFLEGSAASYEIQFPVNGQTITIRTDLDLVSIINAYHETTGGRLTRYTVEWGVFNVGGAFPLVGTNGESYGTYDYAATGGLTSTAVAYSIPTLPDRIEIRAKITHQLE
ncbi:hypothetical protein GTA08_BOTSDO03277 [Botryosphaeria dothidea]|uniref:Uncharacterized protein n=1 Tax=Botryosphaeria dothidea TaxID=55169 RepID=A0A8H4IWY9_9PEZI|nr:hypothetical protein GTA08_BOTSDO03277 [Botryosphaeria dothidea]